MATKSRDGDRAGFILPQSKMIADPSDNRWIVDLALKLEARAVPYRVGVGEFTQDSIAGKANFRIIGDPGLLESLHGLATISD